MDTLFSFIVIDDDVLNNKVCRACIEKLFANAKVDTFTDPQLGLDHIANEYSVSNDSRTIILFLDIKMPVMNGWEFLDCFDDLSDLVKQRIKVYILSSSVEKADMEKAQANKNVVYYLIKPLTKETIALITHGQKKWA